MSYIQPRAVFPSSTVVGTLDFDRVILVDDSDRQQYSSSAVGVVVI